MSKPTTNPAESRVIISGGMKTAVSLNDRGELYSYRPDGPNQVHYRLRADSTATTLDEAIEEYQSSEPLPKHHLQKIKRHEKAVIETFYWNEESVSGRVRSSPVCVLKVPNDIPCTTGMVVSLKNGGEAALLGERRVRRPEPGYRYHEFRMR